MAFAWPEKNLKYDFIFQFIEILRFIVRKSFQDKKKINNKELFCERVYSPFLIFYNNYEVNTKVVALNMLRPHCVIIKN